MTLVGKTAPEFKLQAYHNGEIKEGSLHHGSTEVWVDRCTSVSSILRTNRPPV